MAIEFTDAQLRTASKDLLDTAVQVELLGDQQDQTNDGKQDAYNKDINNKVFYDNYTGIVHQYNEERAALSGDLITEYSEATLVMSAKQQLGNLHFPTSPPWVHFPPKILAENNGNPTSYIPGNEVTTVPPALTAIDELINGYDDGNLQSTLYSAYSPGNPINIVTATLYGVGQRVVIDQGGVSLIGIVLTAGPGTGGTPGFCTPAGPTTQAACLLAGGVWTPGTPSPYPQEITIAVLQPPLGGLGAGSRIRNFHPGFTNAQREHTSTPDCPEVRTYFEDLIATTLQVWQDHIKTQITALNRNDAGGAEVAEIATALSDTQATVIVHNIFIASPLSGSGVGRYGDNIINQVIASLTLRATQAPARAAQILSRFGSISQNSQGAVSGTGQLYNVWKWIELRCSKAGGSLIKYYSFDVAGVFLGSVVTSSENKQAEYASVMSVYKLAGDTNGTYKVSVLDATGLSNLDEVTILDDVVAHGIVIATIQSIDGNDITLDKIVSGITAGDVGRLIKKL